MNTKFILRQICINLNEAKRQWKAGWGEPEFGESEAYALTFLIQTHVRAHTLSPSLHTHSSESPASLPSLVSLGKKSLKKKISPVLWWLRFSASPLPSSVDYLSPTAFQLPAVASAPLPDFISWHKDFQMEALLFSCPLTISFLVFSLHSTVSLLSFPSLLSALAPPPPPPPPPPHSSLPSPTFVCL